MEIAMVGFEIGCPADFVATVALGPADLRAASLNESFGNAAGVPALFTNTPVEIAPLIDRRAGLAVPPSVKSRTGGLKGTRGCAATGDSEDVRAPWAGFGTRV